MYKISKVSILCRCILLRNDLGKEKLQSRVTINEKKKPYRIKL